MFEYAELIIYLLIVLIAFWFAIAPHPSMSNGVKFLLYVFVSSCLSIVVRLSGFDIDIATYADSMRFESISFYYLREPVVWFGQRYLYSVLQSDVLVFILFDVFLLICVYASFTKYRLPYYAFYAFLVFFPFIMGMQNVYRQWVSAIFCLLAFSYVFSNGSFTKRYGLYTLAGLSHNVAGLFLAPLFLMSKSFLERAAGFVVLALTPLLILFAAGSKSAASTGENLVVAYIALLVVMVIFMILSTRLRVNRHNRKSLGIAIFSIYLVFISSVILTSTGAERVGLFSLVLIYPHLVLFIERYYRQAFLLRACLVVFGFAPILIFGVRQFIVP
ncbi:hypothetical protein CWE12_08620 [Aliidiomarina sedimenti]|uniref:EpsG family protein n=1 Tax=Aliidiomarina sedimenti TaxID=1933879 RepID=A0ABY0BZE2_9GAMM|nr:hypothetical protein [Aliidiomarina sedimenti]RUO30014.1 hypothetical protein CWE12_08620 [Aliidiomarina sedimenti]